MSNQNSAARVLAHHGVKGMRWGVRRSRTPVAVTTSQKPGKKVQTKGGSFQEAHKDAVRAATLRQTAKKSTTDSLSDHDLRHLVNRMNLEQQYNRLAAPQKSVGRKIVDKFLTDKRFREQSVDNIQKGHALVKTTAAVGKTIANTPI